MIKNDSRQIKIQIPKIAFKLEDMKNPLYIPLFIYIKAGVNLLDNSTTFNRVQFARFVNRNLATEFNKQFDEAMSALINNGFINKDIIARSYVITPTEKMYSSDIGFTLVGLNSLKTITSNSNMDRLKMLTLYSFMKLRMGNDGVFYSTYREISKNTNISERLVSRLTQKLIRLGLLEIKQSCKSYKQKDGSYKWRKVILVTDKTNPEYEKAIARYEQKLNRNKNNADTNLW